MLNENSTTTEVRTATLMLPLDGQPPRKVQVVIERPAKR